MWPQMTEFWAVCDLPEDILCDRPCVGEAVREVAMLGQLEGEKCIPDV